MIKFWQKYLAAVHLRHCNKAQFATRIARQNFICARFAYVKFFIFLLVLPLFSCFAPKTTNELFEEKYALDIQSIKQRRTLAQNPIQQNSVMFSAPPTQEEVARLSASGGYYPYYDVTKFGEKPTNNYLPNSEVYQPEGVKNAVKIPPDMFYITYKTDLHPKFRRVGVEFDAIQIPPKDAYGVTTEMSQKHYLLAGNNSLQRSVDEINNTRSVDDFEISEILIKEQKRLKQKEKMAKIFGKTKEIEIASIKEEEQSEKLSEGSR